MRFKFIYLLPITVVFIVIRLALPVVITDKAEELPLQLSVLPVLPPTSLQSQQFQTKRFIKYFLSNEVTTNSSQCVFPDPQFSQSEIPEIFAYKSYGECKTTTKAKIEIVNNTVVAECKNGLRPTFLHDRGWRQTLGGLFKSKQKWVKTGDMLPRGEFSLIKCGANSIYAIFRNKFRPEVSYRANRIRKSLGGSEKPFNVIFMLFDQTSKYSVQRNWPEVLNLFNDIKTNKDMNESFSLYEFEKVNSVMPLTIYNMAPILYGMSLEDLRHELGTKILPEIGVEYVGKTEKSMKHIKLQEKSAIWRHYSSLGYTTLFLKDTVYDYVVEFTGRDILADHVFVNFWRTAWSVYGWTDFSNKQRCIGDQNSHALSMDYLLQYLDNYKDNNKFAYVHLDAAHERSGNVKTVDKDLVSFLHKFLNKMLKREENFVLFLMGDHGIKRMPKIQWDIRNFYEANSPMAYMLMSKGVEKKWKLKDTLAHNTKQLLGRFDINFSLKDLAFFPYNTPKESYYEEFKASYNVTTVSSVFSEKLDPLRNCGDIGIRDEYCTCYGLMNVNMYDGGEDTVVNTITSLVEEYFEIKAKENPNCNRLEKFTLTQVKYFQLTSIVEGYDIIFYSEYELETGEKLEVISHFCYQWKIEATGQILPEETNPFRYYDVQDAKFFTQISSVEIINSKCKLGCVC